jgi:hypothetical protein
MYTINLTEEQLTIVKRSLCASALRLVAKLEDRTDRPDLEQQIEQINDLLDSLPRF